MQAITHLYNLKFWNTLSHIEGDSLEINRINNTKTPMINENKSIKGKQDFSQSFNSAKQEKSQEELKHLLNDIKKIGNRLAKTKSVRDVKRYKNYIREYLQSVLEYMYTVKKDISFWQTEYFLTVETINNKLDELTSMLLSEEKDNLKIAATIDDITGLIVDIYK